MTTTATAVETYASTTTPGDHAHVLLLAHLATVLDDMTTQGLADLTPAECVQLAAALSRSLAPQHRETSKSADGATITHSLAVRFEVTDRGWGMPA